MQGMWNERSVLVGAGLLIVLTVVAGGPPDRLVMASPTLFGAGLVLGILTRRNSIGGWLFVYFWGIAMAWLLAVPQAARAISDIVQSGADAFGLGAASTLILFELATYVALCWASVRLLFRRDTQSIVLVRRALWVMVVFNLVLLVFLVVLAGSYDTRPMTAVRPALMALIWLLYVQRSKRVQHFVGKSEATATAVTETAEQTGPA